jgi:type I restriction enzyme S subunit
MLAYLKTKILEIHHFIHNKQRLIELLQEQKQAIISHAVTRGIDPDVRLKPSGIDWLGDVPEHWDVLRIKNVLREVDRREHWDVLRIKNVLREVDRRSSTGNETLLSMTRRRGLVRYDDISEKPASAATLIGYKICEQEEVVMNRMQAWSGMFHVAPERGLVSPDYAVFAPVEDADTAYLGHLLRSPIMVSQFVTESKGIGSGFLRLYTDRFGAIPMPLPSRTEQIDIVLLIQDKSEEIDAAIVHTRRQIDLIREYRTRLIADVVTGKLDVRDVAIDEAAEADAPDDNGFLEDEEDSFMSAGKEYADDA